jgi:hypothetical protein
MAKPKPRSYLVVFVAITVAVSLVAVIMFMQPKKVADDSCPVGKVCLSQRDYIHLTKGGPQFPHYPPLQQIASSSNSGLIGSSSPDLLGRGVWGELRSPQRDRLVLEDPLYPPESRSTDAATQDAMDAHMRNRDLYVPTNDPQDTFRLVGYLVSGETEQRDKGGNTWKLFARQKDRHNGEFYMMPADKNYDLKVPVKDDMVSGERLRDPYTIPDHITFKSPFLNETPYQYIPLGGATLPPYPPR